MLTIKTNIANRNNYGNVRDLKNILYLVVHYTGNDGDTDESNANYFKNRVVYTSAHYFVDDDSVTQSVPDKHVAWHCGAATYKHAKCRNENSIGVEICDDVRNGVIYPSAKTIENALELVQMIMDKYNIKKANVIRHYDVTGKMCPAYWVDDAKWKAEFWNKLNEPNSHMEYTVTASGTFITEKEAQIALENLSILGMTGTITKKANAPIVSEPVVPEKDTSIEEIAREVINGKWGNGAERKKKLTAAGYDYAAVQNMVNKLL